ncbi:heavy metal-binding domain-containing protein [Sphingobacterium zeae]|uniref:heavy metal-binding domain-containing protein n=1 Tax=Sphingobacterium zeae TaxID=1776859 RepID=UPI00360E426C
MIVTTTNSNFPIAANVVIGTNIFSDVGASYVDFFGGRSTSYERKMQEMYKRVTETLRQRFSSSFIDEKFPKQNPIKYVILLWTKCGIY